MKEGHCVKLELISWPLQVLMELLTEGRAGHFVLYLKT